MLGRAGSVRVRLKFECISEREGEYSMSGKDQPGLVILAPWANRLDGLSNLVLPIRDPAYGYLATPAPNSIVFYSSLRHCST